MTKLACDGIGLNRLASLWKLSYCGYIKVSIDYQGEGAWNRSSRHYQLVGRISLFGKSCSLCNSKAVLFIGYDQSQRLVFNVFLDYGMSTNDNVYLARHYLFTYQSLFLGGK